MKNRFKVTNVLVLFRKQKNFLQKVEIAKKFQFLQIFKNFIKKVKIFDKKVDRVVLLVWIPKSREVALVLELAKAFFLLKENVFRPVNVKRPKRGEKKKISPIIIKLICRKHKDDNMFYCHLYVLIEKNLENLKT